MRRRITWAFEKAIQEFNKGRQARLVKTTTNDKPRKSQSHVP